MSFGKRLRALRLEKDMTQADIVNEINARHDTKINAAMWSKWENDRDTPSMDSVRILAKHFNVTLDYLAELSDQKQPKQEHPSAMFKREGLKVLFSAAEDLDDESIKFLQDMANKLKGN